MAPVPSFVALCAKWVCYTPVTLYAMLQDATVHPVLSKLCAAVWCALLVVCACFMHVDACYYTFWFFYFCIPALALFRCFYQRLPLPPRTSFVHCECGCVHGVTRFDVLNWRDWLSLWSIVADPLYLAAVGVTSFGYSVTPLSPKPVQAFEFATDSSANLLFLFSRQAEIAGIVIAIIAVALSQAALFLPVIGSAMLFVLVQIVLASYNTSPYFLLLLPFVTAALLRVDAPATLSNVSYLPRFVVIERACKQVCAAGCIILYCQGRDIAQAALALSANVIMGGLLLGVQKCTTPFISNLRALCHGFSIIGLATTVAIRYGSENARLFGWGALGTLIGFYCVIACCFKTREDEDA
jgi:hypothetical protein